jgi:predicted MPP superfamily phosphohydrolase
LRAAHIDVLQNASRAIRTPRGVLYLAGIGDYRSQGSDVAKALAAVPAGARALCLTHSPDVFPLLPAACLLTIAGHTHGGQVWLPVLGRPAVAGVSIYGQRYAFGLIRENGKTLFVSSGIGTSELPVRLGVPPEISVLEILG